ncbi:MAG: GxxExxY protein [Lentisphaerae bacterium]|nr:GxxExxY protein [Lentisphaerota bacterium]
MEGIREVNDLENLNALTSAAIGAAIEVHREMGPGLLESIYQQCLVMELRERRFSAVAEMPVAVSYKGRSLDGIAFRMDVLLEDAVIVECKSVEVIKPVHSKQLLSYLRLTGRRLGLLINFNEELLKDGITRVANGV